MSETLTGKIEQVRYYSEETAFIVMNVQTVELERPVLMTGYMPDYNLEFSYKFQGEFIQHPKYGKQFKIDAYEMLSSDDREATIRYLSSSLFKGVGPVLASVIVDHLGDHPLEKIVEDPSCLDLVSGMTQEKKDTILEVLLKSDSQQKTLQFLMGHQISLKVATKILGVIPEGTIEYIQENPYQLIEDVDGISFNQADKIAMSLSFSQNHPYRLQAALLTVIKQECMNRGSTYLDLQTIQTRFLKMFSFVDDLGEILKHLVQDEKIVVEDDKYYPYNLYESENIIKKVLTRYINGVSNPDYDFEDVEEVLMDLEEKWNIEYEETQRDAIYSFLDNDLMILSGGPGTGKTTIVKAMIALYKKVEPHKQIALVAPTGRAAKRLSEVCDLPASTIHRLLKWDVNTNTFNHDSEHPIDVDLLIIDEFSMVDSFLFSRLLDACTHVSKILLIGDEAQLPSIAPGQVLYDLIETKQIECVFLKHIFRQQQQSGIISISHALRNNEYEKLDTMSDYPDIHFYQTPETRIQPIISKIINKAVNEGYDLYDFQVLSPMYQGVAGIDSLNEALQEIVNPRADFKKEVKIYNHIFREGDKVLQLKNRPEDNVFNGDLGIIIEIQKRDGIYYQQDKVIVDFEGDVVEYTSQDFNQLTLAYCMSIHKAQGSEFKIVVIPFSTSHSRMFKKNLIYTGMTRAKQSLFLIGDYPTFLQGVKNTEELRQTTLQERFKQSSDFSPYDFL